MSVPDIILVVLVCAGAIWGFMRGFLRGALVLGGLVGALYLANARAVDLGTRLRSALGDLFPLLQTPQVPEITAYVLIVIVALVVIYSLGAVLHKAGALPFLGFFDLVAGSVTGALGSVLAIEIMLLLLAVASPSMFREILGVSVVATRLVSYAPTIFGGLPRELLDNLVHAGIPV